MPHLLFSFCERVGWRDLCTEFTNLIKVDVDVNGCHYQIFKLRNIREIHLFDRYMIIFFNKNANQDQNCSFELIYFQRSEVYTH